MVTGNMPNWCSERLTVSGPHKEIIRFTKYAQSKEEKLDFNNFIPIPKELDGIQKGVNAYRDVKGKMIPLTAAEAKVLQAKVGATNWYDWSITNWGTKWNASEPTLHKESSNKIIYRFKTAWSPISNNLLQAMSKEFPTLTIRLEFAEIGGMFAGYSEVIGGSITSKEWNLTEKDFTSNEEDEESESVYKHDDEYAELVESSG